MEALRSAFAGGTLSKLEGLNVSDNPLGKVGVATLARGLSASPQPLSLNTLRLSDTAAKSDGVIALSRPLKEGKTPSLQDLRLACNSVGAQGVACLGEAVGAGTLSSLKILVLKDNHIAKKSVNGAWDFSGLFVHLSNDFAALEELDLSFNSLRGPEGDDNLVGPRPAFLIGEALSKGRLSAVRRLIIVFMYVRQGDGHSIISALGAGKTPNVEVLHLPRLDPSCSQEVASVMNSGHLAQLRELALNNQESVGCGVVARSIAKGGAPSLRSLTIRMEDPDGDVEMTLNGMTEALRGGHLKSLEEMELQLIAVNDSMPQTPMANFGRALGKASCLRRLSPSPSCRGMKTPTWVWEGSQRV
uniref:Uncharacterized protein n=1 Tax=Chromera velia CCMP2878 TaxID=1169474 RepID=A0A0G4I2C1_9ALVE|eukprot:Cvel_10328.t1-p1 / transcript=Cvel_10328.t1 / gene=Cvel_10328 / organism=Chromera_velia_CCMP2878 / gene_product=hypothetical protein / transcript_product=hypothetical protein / location=Cvel_scaffold620:40681-41754(+) / protein_length=358 / sequence_SO=supercontig / SO=protein_coding / is_pseudo=false